MIYFLQRGRLPWDVTKPDEAKVDAKDPNAYENQMKHAIAIAEYKKQVFQLKSDTDIDQLCQGCPKQFKQYMKYARSLSFDQKPNYKMLRNMFESLFADLNF